MGFSTVRGVQAHESTHRSLGSDAIAGALGLAAIPATLTGKDADTVDGYEGATLRECSIVNTQVHNAVIPQAWTDKDLSAVVGANEAIVLLKTIGNVTVYLRRNGDTETIGSTAVGAGAKRVGDATSADFSLVKTDASGIIEWQSINNAVTVVATVIAYWK